MAKGGGMRFPTVLVFILAGCVRAGLVPVCELEAATKRSDPVTAQAPSPSTVPLLALPSVDELTSDYLDLDAAASQETCERPIPHLLIDRSNSFDLCLYALISLGVFRSGSWLRRPSLGLVPEWYHSGAPRQIGHSHAVGPEAACPAAVCFIQPSGGIDPNTPLQRRGTIVSLWRCAQYTSAVLAGRAPPHLS